MPILAVCCATGAPIQKKFPCLWGGATTYENMEFLSKRRWWYTKRPVAAEDSSSHFQAIFVGGNLTWGLPQYKFAPVRRFC